MKNIKEENIPGLKVTKKSQTDSAKSNKNYYKDTSKKMGDYDKHSKQEDKDGIDPVKHNYDDSTQEYHDQMEIMNGQEMINYQSTDDKFRERSLDAIEGSSKMGNNPEWANVVTDDQAGFTGPKFGKKLAEKIRQSIKKRNSETEKVKFFGDYPYDTEKTSKNYAFENKGNMKRLKFKKPFNGIKNAVKLIPENYRINNKVFEITDGNEKYRLRWEGDNKKGKVVVLLAQNKDLINEDVNKMKHLMGYKSHKTLGNLKNNERLTENNIFNNLLNKSKKILKEDFGEEIESSEPNEVENLYNSFIQAMDSVDENLSNEIFADVVIKIIKEDYGSHLFETFLNKFNSELTTNELESETSEEPLENSEEEDYDRFNEVFYK